MKKILSREAVRRIDEATIKKGTPGIVLMENAAAALVKTFLQLHQVGDVFVLCGPGNNGGDGLAIARMLAAKGIHVHVYHLKSERYSPDFEANFKRLFETGLTSREISSANDLPTLQENDVIIDALFGTGINKALTGVAANVVSWINEQHALRFCVDVPSGMLEQPEIEPDAMVNADHVIAFQIPRVELMTPRVGYNPISVHVVDIELDDDAIASESTKAFLIEENDVKLLMRKRRLFDHKYTFGHALIVAGARRTLGAALLATGAALRSGCGLVTLHSVKESHIALNALYPEAMFSPDAHFDHITSVPIIGKHSAIAIGCGIGRESETQNALVDVLTKTKLPCVLDADALNILSTRHNWKALLPAGSILTPHHKEFDRLTRDHANDFLRMQTQIELAQEIKSVVAVKGAFTRVALPDGTCWFNSTGTAALATAGSGDVLTGLLTGLLARGYSATEAAAIGVYLHGLAGKMVEEKFGSESAKAGDLIDSFPQAFKYLL